MSRSLYPAAKHWQRMVLNAAAAAGGGGACDPVYQWSRSYTVVDACNMTNVAYINDNSTVNAWFHDSGTLPHYVEVDFGESAFVEGISCYTDNDANSQKTRWDDVDVYFSDTQGVYGAAHQEAFAIVPGAFSWGSVTLDTPGEGRYMKLVINDTRHTSNHCSIEEMRIRRSIGCLRTIAAEEWYYKSAGNVSAAACGSSSGLVPAYCFDNDITGTSWYHSSSDQTHWIQWDMGEVLWVGGVQRYTTVGGSTFDWNNCYLQCRMDSTDDWENVVTGLNLVGTGWKDGGVQDLATPGLGRYVRLNFQKNPLSNAFCRIWEIQPYVAPLVAI